LLFFGAHSSSNHIFQYLTILYERSSYLKHSILGSHYFMAIIFVATIILNSYIFVLDNQLTQQVYLSRVALQKATLIIDYGNGQRKIFEGDVPTGGLSLYDALLASAQTGSISVQFSKTADGRVSLVKIDQYVNNMDHYWELQIPKFNWKEL